MIKTRGTSGQSKVLLILVLVVLALAAWLLYKQWAGSPDKEKIVQQQATITAQAEKLESFSVLVLNLLSPKPAAMVSARRASKSGAVVGTNEPKESLAIFFEDWLTPAGSKKGTPTPTEYAGAPQNFEGLLSPPPGFRIYSFVIWGDQFMPTRGGMVNGNKVYWLIQGAQLFGCPDSIAFDKDDPNDLRCREKGQAIGNVLTNPSYKPKLDLLINVRNDKRVALACSNQRKYSDGQMVFELNCDADYMRQGTVNAIGPGLGMNTETSFFLAYDGQGVALLPMKAEYWDLRPAGLGTINP